MQISIIAGLRCVHSDICEQLRICIFLCSIHSRKLYSHIPSASSVNGVTVACSVSAFVHVYLRSLSMAPAAINRIFLPPFNI